MQVREMKVQDVEEYAQLYRGAYPGTGMSMAEASEGLSRRLEAPDLKCLVLEGENGKLLGGLTMHDFTIYHGGSELKMGGIGSVAVALDAKKSGVAKILLADALERMLKADVMVSTLYPFRHDFYQQMGWGQVGEVKEFKFAPSSLPVYPERRWVRRFKNEDLPGVQKCYDQFAMGGNCTAKRPELFWERKMKVSPDLFVYEKDGQIEGYVQIAFPKDGPTFLHYDMSIVELVYNTQEAYFGILGFIASQFDQVASVYYYTRRSDPFHFLLKEPRRAQDLFNRLYHFSQKVGVGWMYRLVDMEKALRARANYNGANLDVTFVIEDSFLPRNSGSYHFVLKDGKPTVTRGEENEYIVKTDISTFAQLFTNYMTFSQAMQIRKAEVSNPAVLKALEEAFLQPEALMMEFF